MPSRCELVSARRRSPISSCSTCFLTNVPRGSGFWRPQSRSSPLRARTSYWRSAVPSAVLFYAVQAKKLYPDDRYAGLNSGPRTRAQLGKLNRFARQIHAVPLYLLYNHSDTASGRHWHCDRPFDVDQLGCTLVPSWYVKQLVEQNGRRRKSFDLLNRCSDSIPWRCLFDCHATCRRLEHFLRGSVPFRRPKGASAVSRDESGEDDWWPVERLRAPWPEWLFDEASSTLTLESFDRLRAEISEVHGGDGAVVDLSSRDFDGRLYPARILVVDQLG